MSTPYEALDPIEDSATALPDQTEGAEATNQPTPTPAELKALKAELRAEKRAREAAEKLADERKTVKEFWERRGQAAEAVPRQVPAAIEQADPLDDFDWLNTLTNESDPAKIKQNIAKAVKAQIAAELKRGNYVSREEAEGYVQQMVTSASAFNKLIADFPGLRDSASEFFAETQKQLATLGNDPSLNGTPQAALERMAAQQAEIALARAGKAVPAQSTEDDRYDRVARQRGGSPGRGQATADTTLNAAEKAMAAKLGIPEAKYLARKREMMAPGAVGPALMADRMAREFGNG